MCQRPTKSTLSTNYILEKALAFIDQVGLDKFTMRKLGQQLDVSAMAVYRYFPNQKALFDELGELIWEKVLRIELDESMSWQEQLISLMKHLRKILLQHPNVLPLVSSRAIVTSGEFILLEKVLKKLLAADLKIKKDTVFLINSLSFYTLGFVWGEGVEENSRDNAKALKQTLNKSPLLQQFVQPLQDKKVTNDEQFLMGLNALLKGWQ